MAVDWDSFIGKRVKVTVNETDRDGSPQTKVVTGMFEGHDLANIQITGERDGRSVIFGKAQIVRCMPWGEGGSQ